MDDTHELPDSMFLVVGDRDDGSAGAETLGFSRTPTILLSFAANRFTRNAAREYQRRFGIGAMDWRMLVMLTRVPGSSVAVASRTIGIDKAAVSRSLQRLKQKGLAEDESSDPDERRKKWQLTAQGQELHQEILKVALSRQKKLLQGFSKEDVLVFNAYLQRFLTNLDALNKEDEGRD
jgi:DNA-binding MarR family transcriptional regulator